MENAREVLRALSFRCNKALGQNFITDGNLLQAIVSDAGIGESDTVVEIGTGAGTLTAAIAAKAARVVSFEVDRALEDVLSLTLKGVENAEVVFSDVLKMSDEEIEQIAGGEFSVVANLPYYVTTPMIMRFLESGLNVKSATFTVQKEVAQRLTARAGTVDYSAITLAVEIEGTAAITREISRKMFYPVPNVDSAVVRIDVDRNKFELEVKTRVKRLVRAAFAMRRKTLANNISAALSIPKSTAEGAIVSAGFSPTVRGEALSLDDFVKLTDLLFN